MRAEGPEGEADIAAAPPLPQNIHKLLLILQARSARFPVLKGRRRAHVNTEVRSEQREWNRNIDEQIRNIFRGGVTQVCERGEEAKEKIKYIWGGYQLLQPSRTQYCERE